ncbi:uncharacterized protein LOC105645487 [Jatropha curcas]|uniref:uncharacterized protein LOC105645487 n=1 Tax=Jatropha curcas TaxID=180498 RepID=UPI0005FBFA22|nr:uncharacterized protein LOC105645487 [Jatropha curcas]
MAAWNPNLQKGAFYFSFVFFVDDSIIFTRAKEGEADVIADFIAGYEWASGQQINLDKSEISFIKSALQVVKELIRNKLRARAIKHQSMYLGLPAVIGRSKKQVFQTIYEHVEKKLKGWKEKTLSGAGKEILLKTVAQVILNCTMSCFPFPSGD